MHSPHRYMTKAYLATPMDEVEVALVCSCLYDKHYRILPFLQFVCQFQATTHILELVTSFYLSLCVFHVASPGLWLVLFLEQLLCDCRVCNHFLH